MALLEATNVTKRFGGLVAVSSFDFRIDEAEIASIIGPNGAGKTTFFNCVTGFYEIDEGDIFFDATSVHGKSPDQITRLGVSRTYQNIRLFAQMTVIENILVGMEPLLHSHWWGAVFGAPSTRREETDALEEASRLLRFVGLDRKSTRLNSSHSQQSRMPSSA